MKSIRFIFGILLFSLAVTACKSDSEGEIPTDVIDNPASAEGVKSNSRQAEISFTTTEHNFDKVIDGEVVRYSFEFENTGKGDLVITAVKADCGCTVAEYPEKAVKPGEKGYIDVQFDSRRRIGFNHKRITVLSNAVPNKVVLHIKAKVYRPEQIGN